MNNGRLSMRKRIILFTIVMLMSSGIAYAGGLATVEYNYINDLIGARATGLGGAYTAISDDPSGAYYNPAGLVFAVDNQISLSVNSYKQKDVTFDKAVSGNPYKQQISSWYPSFFGVVQTLGPVKIGVSIINTNNEILDQDDKFRNIQISAKDQFGQWQLYPGNFDINYNITDNTLMGGLSAAYLLSNNFSIGVTAYGFKRRREQIANQLITFSRGSSNSYMLTNQYITDEWYGAIGKIGMQFMPIDVLSLGVSVSQTVVTTHTQDSQSLEIVDHNDASIVQRNKSYSDDKLPLEIRTGIAFFPDKTLLISFDMISHIGNQYYQVKTENTFNFAAGVEWYVLPSFPVGFGFFTNFANTPPVNANNLNQEMHVDQYGTSLSLSWQTKNSSISLAGFYMWGDGDAQIIGSSNSVQKTHLRSFSISLTGSARY